MGLGAQEEDLHPAVALEEGFLEGFPLRAWWHIVEELQVLVEELCRIEGMEPGGRRDCRCSGWLSLASTGLG